MDDDEGASLFEGMEFVSSDALSSPTADANIAAIDAEIDGLLQPSSDKHGSSSFHADSSTAHSSSLEAEGGNSTILSSPLDADLFSAGLTSDPILNLSSEPLTSEAAKKVAATDVGLDKVEVLRSEIATSTNAAVNPESVVTILDTSVEAPVAPSAGIVKKKKRSIKIGYARDSADATKPEQTPAVGSEKDFTATSSSSILSSLEALSQDGSVLLSQEPVTVAVEPGGKESTQEASKEDGNADVSLAGEVTEEDVEEIEMEAAAEQRQGGSVRVPNDEEDKEHKQEAFTEKQGKPDDSVELLPSSSLDQVVAQLVTEGEGEGDGVNRIHASAQTSEPDSHAQPEEASGRLGNREAGGMEEGESSPEAAAQIEVSTSDSQVTAASEADESDLPGPAGELRKEARKVLSSLAARLGSVQSRSREVAMARKKAAQMRRQAAARAAAASARLVEVEAELAGAVEREEFEEADALSERATQLEGEVKDWQGEVRGAEEKEERLMGEMRALAEEEDRVEMEGVEELMAMYERVDAAASEAASSAESKSKEASSKLAVAEEAVEARQRKLALEQRVLEEEERELAAKLEAATKPEREERDALVTRRRELEGDLEALLALVREKEEEIAEQAALIAAADERVQLAGSRFDKLQAGLKEEEARVAAMKAELAEAESALAEQRAAILSASEAANVAVERLKGVGREVEEEASRLKKGVDERARAGEEEKAGVARRDSLAAREKQVEEELSGLAADIASLRGALQDLSVRRQQLQQQQDSIEQRLAVAARRLPELEAEKKQAAGSRNFKEAARLVAEGKQLANDRAAALEEKERFGKEMTEIEEEERRKVGEVAELEGMVKEKERELAAARCARLRLVAAAARASMEAAAEAEDYEEADGLNEEADNADGEAEKLKALHCLEGKEYERVE